MIFGRIFWKLVPSARSLAVRFGIGISADIRWLRREREDSEQTARRQGRRRGLRLTGMTASFVHDGPMNGRIFQIYLEQVFIPTLTPGDIVVIVILPRNRVS